MAKKTGELRGMGSLPAGGEGRGGAQGEGVCGCAMVLPCHGMQRMIQHN